MDPVTQGRVLALMALFFFFLCISQPFRGGMGKILGNLLRIPAFVLQGIAVLAVFLSAILKDIGLYLREGH